MTRTTGKQALIELLRSEGVSYVFGIPGATEIQFMDAIERAPDIEYILGLHELVCAGMAEGYARVSGKVPFLNLHNAAGLAAALPILYNVYFGGVPMVITAGQNDTRLLQRDPALTGDMVGMMKPFTKWTAELVHAKDLPTVIQRAFKSALQAPTGPVFVSLPQNVLEEEFELELEPRTVVYPRLRPDKAALDCAVRLLAEADSPVMMVESGVARSDALDEVVRLAELSGAKVYQSWMADVNFPVSHPQYLGDLDPTTARARSLLGEADMFIGVGCSLFAEAFYSPEPALSKNTRSIQVDDDPWELGKNFPIDCALQGDIKTVLTELNEMLERAVQPAKREANQARVSTIAREKAEQHSRLQAACAAEAANCPIAISRLMTEIGKVATPDTIVVDECWSASEALRNLVPRTKPRTYFRARKGGSLGAGLPGALGAKLGQPEKDVIAVVGDGSAAWSMQTFWTAARYRVPVTYVITNNATYRQVKLVRRRVLGDDAPFDAKHAGMELDPVMDFCLLARSMGVNAERITDPDDLNRALTSAVSSGEPRLIEVMVGSPA
jgi:benzoylformate decarboxylase